MSEIPHIGVQNVDIPRIQAPGIYNYVPHTQTPPVVVNIGSPIVDMPGCVKFHPDAAKNRETPNLKEEDSQGTKVLCDGQYPMYDAMDYTPEDLLIKVDTPPPVVQPPPEIDPPEVPPTGISKSGNAFLLLVAIYPIIPICETPKRVPKLTPIHLFIVLER